MLSGAKQKHKLLERCLRAILAHHHIVYVNTVLMDVWLVKSQPVYWTRTHTEETTVFTGWGPQDS